MNLSLLAGQLAVSCLTSTDRALAATRSSSAVAMPRPCQASATATVISALADLLNGQNARDPYRHPIRGERRECIGNEPVHTRQRRPRNDRAT